MRTPLTCDTRYGLCATCYGAALEVSLSMGYNISQGFGWEWGEEKQPARAARFNVVMLGYVAVALALPPLPPTAPSTYWDVPPNPPVACAVCVAAAVAAPPSRPVK